MSKRLILVTIQERKDTDDAVTTDELQIDAVKCEECGRVFDLFDEDQAEEYHYGHDCETGE